uniref:hypothetical protein n=1 Tax=Flavobacterium sp. TaxID=239 RepID=UPI0025BC121B
TYVELIKKEFDIYSIQNKVISFSGSADINNTDVFYSERNPEVFKSSLENVFTDFEKEYEIIVVLHYVSYGYHYNGIPFWLLKIIKLIDKHSKVSLITLFHEISASGPIWTKAGLTAPLQRYIARTIAIHSDRMITTTNWYRKVLEAWFPVQSSIKVIHQPVFSNMGTPTHELNFSVRKKQMVVFGGRNLRKDLYDRYLTEILKIKKNYQIECIIDIGAPLEPEFYAETGIISYGVLPEEEIAGILSTSLLGLIHYDLRTIDKSGVFASYQAFGLPTYIFADKHLEFVPQHTLHYSDKIASMEELESLSKQFEQNYKNRSLTSLMTTLTSELSVIRYIKK